MYYIRDILPNHPIESKLMKTTSISIKDLDNSDFSLSIQSENITKFCKENNTGILGLITDKIHYPMVDYVKSLSNFDILLLNIIEDTEYLGQMCDFGDSFEITERTFGCPVLHLKDYKVVDDSGFYYQYRGKLGQQYIFKSLGDVIEHPVKGTIDLSKGSFVIVDAFICATRYYLYPNINKYLAKLAMMHK